MLSNNNTVSIIASSAESSNEGYYAPNTDSLLFSRQLWDEEWIEAGCPLDRYPENTDYDNASGTYITNYIVAMTAFFGIVIFLIQDKQNPNDNYRKRRPDLVQHLFFLDLTFFVAGIYHQTKTTSSLDSDDVPFLELLAPKFAYCSLMLSLPGLVLAFLPRLASNKAHELMVESFFGVSAFSMFIIGIKTAQFLSGLIYFIVSVVLAGVEFLNYQASREMKIVCIPWCLAMLCTAIGLSIQFLYSKSCGSTEAYMNCFNDCVFDYKFNHNAVFHLLVNFSVLFVILGGYNLPPGEEYFDVENNRMLLSSNIMGRQQYRV